MCLYAISHAAAARQRYSILQHQLRSAKNARTSGHTPPFAPELSSWHRQTEVELPVGRRRRTARGRDCPALHSVLLPRGARRESPVPTRQGALVLGKDFVKSNSVKQPRDRQQRQQGSRSRLVTPCSPSAAAPTEHTASTLLQATRAGATEQDEANSPDLYKPRREKKRQKKDKKKPNLTSGCWERFRSITAL